MDDQPGVAEELSKNYCGISKKNGTMSAGNEQCKVCIRQGEARTLREHKVFPQCTAGV